MIDLFARSFEESIKRFDVLAVDAGEVFANRCGGFGIRPHQLDDVAFIPYPARFYTAGDVTTTENRVMAQQTIQRGRGDGEQSRHWFFRATARLVMLPTALSYALFVFLSQYTAWNGITSLYQQHAFLLPVPFLGR